MPQGFQNYTMPLLCLHPPCSMRTTFLPLVDNVCSQLDDTFSRTHRCPCSHSKRRDEKKLPMDKVGKITEDDTRLAISLNVSKYKPDELKVNIDGRTITVEGKQEVQEGSTYTARSFLRRWTLPENVDVEQIRSTISEDGQLAIEAPKHKSAATSRSIPIQRAADQS